MFLLFLTIHEYLEKYLISVRVNPFYLKQVVDLPNTPPYGGHTATAQAQHTFSIK